MLFNTSLQHKKGGEIMTNGELAKQLSQYPLTAIATGLVDFERFNNQLNKLTEENLPSDSPTIPNKTNPLTLPEEERRKLFGERIKMMRKLRGFTRSEFAKLLGVSRPLIAAYETGTREPSLKNLIALVQALNINTDWLLGLSPQLSE
jgi:DNA-binding XRE family transcriptional regulator